MPPVESTMMPLGTEAPHFDLPNTNPAFGGERVSMSGLSDEGGPLVVAFLCNHCPFVVHVADRLAEIARAYSAKGVSFVGISSNDVATHPDDGPEKMTLEAEARGYAFPYLYDEDQSVARAYAAACTPDFFVFDAGRRLVYRGRMDETRPSDMAAATGADLTAALDAVIAGDMVSAEQRPSVGCGIKWKPGNRPANGTGRAG
ncbi:MAG: thioredoxin family protein [Planctomycetota bacterium]